MKYPETPEQCAASAARSYEDNRLRKPIMWGVGGEVRTKSEHVLASVRYASVNAGEKLNAVAAWAIMKAIDFEAQLLSGVINWRLSRTDIEEALKYLACYEGDGQPHPNIDVLKAALWSTTQVVVTFIFDDVPVVGVEDATLKLCAMSHGYFKPGELKFDGIFGALPNVEWEGDTPLDATDVDQRLIEAAFGGRPLSVTSADKFPLYLNRVNVLRRDIRIVDAVKVRLGANVGNKVTMMPGASYQNFNTFVEGPNMNEGRVSSEASVGAHTVIGGGVSILGTLSGGNKTPITVGRNCVLEANCTVGIPVGDAVIIAADTAILQGSMVHVKIEGHLLFGQIVKAVKLKDINAATFRRNDFDGGLEVVRTGRNVEFARMLEGGETILNKDLHQSTVKV